MVKKDTPTSGERKEDSFHTPMFNNSMLSASIRAGAFDTNAKALHTCSLPDLRSLFATTPSPTANVEEAAPDSQEINEEGGEEEEEEEEEGGESEIEEELELLSRYKEESGEETPAGGDQLKGEESGSEEEEEEEEGWSSSDDEDFHQLVQTLQSYVEEAST